MAWREKAIGFFTSAVKSGNFNRVMEKVKIVEIQKGRLTAELQLSKECCNVHNMLHGGMSATLIDHLSTVALKSHFYASDLEAPDSVSIELSCSYLSAVPEGNTIRLEAETIRVGRKVAFLKANIYNKENGKLAVTGKHTKFLM